MSSSRGPSPEFGEAHMIFVLLQLEHGAASRSSLREQLKIGDGTARTIFKTLKKQGFIGSTTHGHKLSPKGTAWLKTFHKNVSSPLPLAVLSLTTAGSRAAVVLRVKAAARKISSGIEQRDAAIRVGADGATTLTVSRTLCFPRPREAVDVKNPVAARQLRSSFALSRGDVLIIGFGRTIPLATLGALAAALSIA